MVVHDDDRPLRVVVFFSGGASGFRYLADHDPEFDEAYEVVGGFSDDPDCAGVGRLRRRGIPVETRDLRAFYAEREAETRDLGVRAEFDAATASTIDRFDPDLVLLSGYMWIVTAPLMEAYPILNVHPADLTIEDEDGSRRFVGYNPVYDAIAAGQDETRSSVHFVTEDVDEGPIVAVSRPFPVYGELVATLL
ncbi:MAG: formyltransferase family protein, partial [Halobacteriales archaeon]|nr:formyltransferase family protein [Halobacteriales archaeon]